MNRYLGKDQRLKRWTKRHKKQFFRPVDAESFSIAKVVIDKAPHWKEKIIHGVIKVIADPYIVALAKTHEAKIITEESKDVPGRIPMVADSLGIKSINLFEFFTERGLAFVKKANGT